MLPGREPWSCGYGRRLTFWRSWVRIPVPYSGRTFFTLICCKILLLFVWKRPKINEKEGHFYKNKSDCNWLWTMPQIWKLGWNHLKVDVLMESFNSLPRCVRVCIKGIFYRCLSASSSSVYKKMGKQIWWFRTKIFSVHFLHDWVWLRRRCWFWFTDDVILK